MHTYEVPEVGAVEASIDKQEFFQAGAVLRTVGSMRRATGEMLSLEEQERVTSYLKGRHIIDQ